MSIDEINFEEIDFIPNLAFNVGNLSGTYLALLGFKNEHRIKLVTVNYIFNSYTLNTCDKIKDLRKVIHYLYTIILNGSLLPLRIPPDKFVKNMLSIPKAYIYIYRRERVIGKK